MTVPVLLHDPTPALATGVGSYTALAPSGSYRTKDGTIRYFGPLRRKLKRRQRKLLPYKKGR